MNELAPRHWYSWYKIGETTLYFLSECGKIWHDFEIGGLWLCANRERAILVWKATLGFLATTFVSAKSLLAIFGTANKKEEKNPLHDALQIDSLRRMFTKEPFVIPPRKKHLYPLSSRTNHAPELCCCRKNNNPPFFPSIFTGNQCLVKRRREHI